jgi:ribosomal protein S18 acetylase RimI-like enzyme
MNILRANDSHLEPLAELFDLYRQFYDLAADRDLCRAYLQEQLKHNSSVVFVAISDDQNAIGFTQMYPTFCSLAAGPIYVLYDLFVRPEVRGQGVGRALMERARQHAEETGALRIDLSTAKGNKPAHALYDSLGYRRDYEFYSYSLDIGRH